MSRGRGRQFQSQANDFGDSKNVIEFRNSSHDYRSHRPTGYETEQFVQNFNSHLNIAKVSSTVDSEWDDWDNNSTPAAPVQNSYNASADRYPKPSYGQSNGSRFDEPETNKRSCFESRDDDPWEVKISSRHVGLIIGKGGAKIKELQSSSGAKIDIQKNQPDDSGMISVSLKGDLQCRQEAKKMIEELISNDSSFQGSSESKSFSSSRQQGSFGGGSRSSTRGDQMQDDCLEMLVPSKLLGRIIGKGGQKIKEIQQNADVNIKIDDDRSSDESKVLITGTETARLNAKQIIEELIESSNDFGNARPSNYGNARNDSLFGGKPSSFDTNSQVRKVMDTSSTRSFDWDAAIQESDRFEKIKWDGYPAIKKNFYIEDPEVANLSPEEVAEIRLKHNKIMVQNFDEKSDTVVPNPICTFDEAFGHFPDILSELKRAGFSTPSPIQMQGWPIALQGLDLIGIAQTGTGKTLAFLLPAFIHIEGQPVPREKRGGPNVLVLSPTRELAIQIEQEVKKYKYRDINCVCVYGGGNRREQINVVTKGVEIVVATPGRLNDLIMNNFIDVRSVTYLVLDEADRMLDLGFEPEIRKILIDVRPDRQTIMTSATWPEGVRRLAKSYMRNPVQVFVGSLDLTAVHSVYQQIEILEEDDKQARLVEFLTTQLGEDDKVIVFMGRKITVDNVTAEFALSDIRCQSIHGGREQYDREQALEDLKNGTVKILIATDVASRGIDIKDITHVLNYDFPHNIEEYVHRVGRTGRAGRSGEAITFMTRKDWRHAADLIKIMEEANQEVPQAVYDMATRFSSMQERRKEERSSGGGYGGGRGGRREESDFGNYEGFGDFGGRPRRGRGKDRCLRVAYM